MLILGLSLFLIMRAPTRLRLLSQLLEHRGYPVGHKRKWKDGEYVKQSDGSWKKLALQDTELQIDLLPVSSPQGTRMPTGPTRVPSGQGNDIHIQKPLGVEADMARPSASAPLTQSGMATAKVIERKRLGSEKTNANVTELLTLEDDQGNKFRGVFKPSDGEEPGLRGNIPSGSYWKREAAAFNVARVLGMEDLVPETVGRRVDGAKGSLQLFVPTDPPKGLFDKAKAKATGVPWIHLNRPDAERMRVFDFIAANTDRHSGNILYRGTGSEMKPVLIDNGLTFPEGKPEIIRTPSYTHAEHKGELLDSTKELIKGIKPAEIAYALKSARLSADAIEQALYRLQSLKKDPSLLEHDEDNYNAKLLDAARNAENTLTGEEKEELRKLAD